MGNGSSIFSFKRLKDKLYGNKEVRILMCGLDAAGKTTVLYKLKLGEVVTTIPTIGKCLLPCYILKLCAQLQTNRVKLAVALFTGFSTRAWVLRLR